ncbi:MAG: hypothetical protein ACLTR6_10810 [Clostridium fessum]
MDACDVFVGMTTASGAAIYNNHLKELMNQKKLREVSICLRHIDNFTRGGALADYEAVYADGVEAAGNLERSEDAPTSPPGWNRPVHGNERDGADHRVWYRQKSGRRNGMVGRRSILRTGDRTPPTENW